MWAREEGFYADVFGVYRIVLRTLLQKASTAGGKGNARSLDYLTSWQG